MKKSLSAIEIRILEKELKGSIGAFVDKIYQYDQKEFALQLHSTGKGKQIIRILPAFIWLADEKPKAPEKIAGFCQLLRKHLEGTRLSAVEQLGSERILTFTFTRKESPQYLVVELFSKGNTILLDENKKILGAAEQQEWRDRKVKTGEQYKAPPSKHDVFSMKEDEFAQILVESKENVSKTLATRLGLGGETAEQLCGLAGVDQKKQATADDAKELFAELQKMLCQKPTESFSKALESELAVSKAEAAEEEIGKRYASRLKKLEKMIAAQQENLESLEKDALQHQRKGELIYENYQQLKQILDELKKAREKLSWQEIKQKLKGHKTIKQIDEKVGNIVLEV